MSLACSVHTCTFGASRVGGSGCRLVAAGLAGSKAFRRNQVNTKIDQPWSPQPALTTTRPCPPRRTPRPVSWSSRQETQLLCGTIKLHCYTCICKVNVDQYSSLELCIASHLGTMSPTPIDIHMVYIRPLPTDMHTCTCHVFQIYEPAYMYAF